MHRIAYVRSLVKSLDSSAKEDIVLIKKNCTSPLNVNDDYFTDEFYFRGFREFFSSLLPERMDILAVFNIRKGRDLVVRVFAKEREEGATLQK